MRLYKDNTTNWNFFIDDLTSLFIGNAQYKNTNYNVYKFNGAYIKKYNMSHIQYYL